VNLALLGQHVGEDIWSFATEDGRSLRSAIDWFIPFISEGADWTWQQISPFDHGRYAHLFRHAAVHYGDARYRKILDAVAPDDFASDRIHLTHRGPVSDG